MCPGVRPSPLLAGASMRVAVPDLSVIPGRLFCARNPGPVRPVLSRMPTDKPTRRRWLFKPFLRPRDKVISAVSFLAAAALMLGLGWISWVTFGVLASVEAAILLVMPTRQNREALEAAADIGVVDRRDVPALERGEDES